MTKLWDQDALDQESAEAEACGRRWLEAGLKWKRGMVAFASLHEGGARGSCVIEYVTSDGRPLSGRVLIAGGAYQSWDVEFFSSIVAVFDPVPDPRDDGFLGHAIAQAREAWRERRLSPRCGTDSGVPWSVESGCDDGIGSAGRGATEDEALRNSLLNALRMEKSRW